MPREKKSREERNEGRRERLKERNIKIRAEYRKEWERGYRTDKIIQDLTKRYALADYTLEDIVFNRGKYKKM
jgi:hypothetical protein